MKINSKNSFIKIIRLYANNEDYFNEEAETPDLDKISALETYGTDITLKARQGLIEETFGREKEIMLLLEILARKQKNNPVLVGEPGVGKTAIIELLASKLVNNKIPYILEGRSIISLDLSKIIAGSRYRGEFEMRFKKVIEEALAQPNVILFIDEIHTIAGAGSAEGSLDAANILKPVLSRSGFQCIGATTIKEYQRIEKDAALNRRFQPIRVEEPSFDEAKKILFGLRPSLEAYHNVKILPSAIKSSIELSSKYITDRFLPDKALDLLDRAAARKSILSTDSSKVSFLYSLINTNLRAIKNLKLSAYQKNDVYSLIIFQELENCLKHLLINSKKDVVNTNFIENNIIQYDKWRLSTLIKAKENYFLKMQEIQKDLTINIKKSSINFKLLQNVNINNYNLNLYKNWSNKTNFKSEKDLLNCATKKYIHRFNFYKDIDINFLNYFKKLKPMINKSILNIFLNDSNIDMSFDEKECIKGFLGYYTKNTTKSIRVAKKIFDTNKNLSRFDIHISKNDIQEILAEIANIPVNKISEEESDKLSKLESILHSRVIGQNEAISAISRAIRRARAGIQLTSRPIASFLFCGPTGVGKTEITKTLAECMFGSESSMIRFDMSEFMEKFSISRLIGSPPGYVGYEDGGQLTDAIRRNPFNIVLFDEIEKAHPDILNILLQILEDGRLTDNQKRLVSFENTIIIMTSNVGASDIQNYIKKNEKTDSIDKSFDQYKQDLFSYKNVNKNFVSDTQLELLQEFKNNIFAESKKSSSNLKKNSLKNIVMDKLESMFAPEFLNRLDDIIIFEPLKFEELRLICNIMISNLSIRLSKKNIKLTVSESAINKLVQEGYNPKFGARPLRRSITKNLEDLISSKLLNIKKGNTLKSICVEIDKSGQFYIKS